MTDKKEREAFEKFVAESGRVPTSMIGTKWIFKAGRASMQAEVDELKRRNRELECTLASYDIDDAAYYRGQEDGVRGAAMRWRHALHDPIPASGVMNSPLEALYRETEALRLRVAELKTNYANLRNMFYAIRSELHEWDIPEDDHGAIEFMQSHEMTCDVACDPLADDSLTALKRNIRSNQAEDGGITWQHIKD